ncbi:MAG: FHA domain-containing protein [Gemmataceae bacterium]|nr:FHA domain-containing protein [Gemmataceae bacterium]
MSFNLFLYYCAIFGGYAALAAGLLGRAISPAQKEGSFSSGLIQTLVDGAFLGGLVALAVGLLDTLWISGLGNKTRLVTRGFGSALIGALGGILGSVITYMLIKVSGLDFLILAGWVVTGLLIGVSLGLFDRLAALAQKQPFPQDKKIANGLLGGALGGFLGGVLFLLSKALLGLILGKENLISASALGFAALGGGIGFFIGLAQVLLKDAWISVVEGKKTGKELILSKAETLVGRSEACDVGLFGDTGVEKNHAKIIRKNNQYFLEDQGSQGGTFLNEQKIGKQSLLKSGDTFRLGQYLLRFNEKPGKRN